MGSAINIFSLENSDTEFSAEQERLRRQLMRFRAVSLDNAWQQYSLGLLSEDSWQQARERGATCGITALSEDMLSASSRHLCVNMPLTTGKPMNVNNRRKHPCQELLKLETTP